MTPSSRANRPAEREALGDLANFDLHYARTPAEVPDEAWAAADAVMLWHVMDLGAAEAAKLENCRIISRIGIGYDRIDAPACGAAGIQVSNVPAYDMSDVATTAVTLALNLLRGVVTYNDRVRTDITGGWSWDGPPILRRVRGQKFGIVGCGRIGTMAALRARAFGMEVGYFDPYLPVGHDITMEMQRFPSLEALLGWADVVTLHTPLNEETWGLIDSGAVAAMKPGMILVNAARGGLVDTDALHEGLKSGRIAGCGIDAFTLEPPDPAHPLLKAYNGREDWLDGRMIVIPHATWYSPETFNDIRREAAENIRALFVDGVRRNVVNEGPFREV
ncbi:MAG: C-terminal binding protein [Minwuia sp.]|uniref:C-terminal binding protein n=1 Tax=Minwuia sp. TaxID=2493630 RepID=UPI003A87FAD8